MKKIILSMLILISALLLFACEFPFNIPGFGGGDTESPSGKPSSFTVTFDSKGGSEVPSQTVTAGELCIKPEDPLREDCKFLYWWDGDVAWYFEYNKITSDITLYAKWEATDYNITYDLSGGKYDGKLPNTYNIDTKPFTLGIPEKEGSVFMGWILGDEYVTELPFSGLNGDITLVADFAGPNADVLESSTATARTWDNVSSIKVRLSDTAPSASALTVKIDLNKEWDTVKVVQGTKTSYVKTYLDGENRMLNISMLPNTEDAIITPTVLVGEEILESEYGIMLDNGIKVDTNYFPGFVRKSVTFTIDDGKVDLDNRFLSIMRPAGIVGTFNLIDTKAATAAEYLALYKGYEVANHHKLHTLPWTDGFDFSRIEIKDEIFSSSTADTAYMYKTEIEGLYYIDYKQFDPNSKSPYWHPIATDETYKKYVDITKDKIEAVFGEGTVVGFAYPHGKLSTETKQYLIDSGYLYARKTGVIGNTTNFNLPKDRFEWSYNANATNLNYMMGLFDKYEDDGNLKFFSFGVHSADYSGQWQILEEFAEKYGNRPEDFYYASNRDIFEYENAARALEISETGIINNSDIDVFVTINNVKTIIYAHSIYTFN